MDPSLFVTHHFQLKDDEDGWAESHSVPSFDSNEATQEHLKSHCERDDVLTSDSATATDH